MDADKALDMLSHFIETIAIWKRLAAEVPAEESLSSIESTLPDISSGNFLPV